jgi:hypothetical protein
MAGMSRNKAGTAEASRRQECSKTSINFYKIPARHAGGISEVICGAMGGILIRNRDENRPENAVCCIGGRLPNLRDAAPEGKKFVGQTMTVDGGYVAQ